MDPVGRVGRLAVLIMNGVTPISSVSRSVAGDQRIPVNAQSTNDPLLLGDPGHNPGRTRFGNLAPATERADVLG